MQLQWRIQRYLHQLSFRCRTSGGLNEWARQNDYLYELIERLGECQRGRSNYTRRKMGVTEVTQILNGRVFPRTQRLKEDTIYARQENVFPGECLLI
jgi:hypothetical protein